MNSQTDGDLPCFLLLEMIWHFNQGVFHQSIWLSIISGSKSFKNFLKRGVSELSACWLYFILYILVFSAGRRKMMKISVVCWVKFVSVYPEQTKFINSSVANLVQTNLHNLSIFSSFHSFCFFPLVLFFLVFFPACLSARGIDVWDTEGSVS